MGIRVAYGRWQDLPKEIESGVVPKDCLIVAKHRNNEAELMFYDAYGALRFVGDSRSFESTDEAMDYLTKNPQMQGKWIAVRNDAGNYIGYMVQADNKLTELGSSADLVDLQTKVEELEKASIHGIKINGTDISMTDGVAEINVPVKTSDLQNDSNFQTAEQVDTAVKTAVADAGKAVFKKVDILPVPQDARDGVFYLVMNEKSGHYDIYSKIGEELVWIDDTVSSLEGYLNEEQVTALIDKKMTIEQGIENAGKIMAVGPDGMVVPADKREFYAKKWGDFDPSSRPEKSCAVEYHFNYACMAKKTMNFVVDINGRGFQSGATFVHVVINGTKVASTPVRLKFEGEKSMAYLAEQFDGGNPDVNEGYTIKYLGGTKISISTEDPAKAIPFDAEYKLTGLGGHTPRQPFNKSIIPVEGSVFEIPVESGDLQFVPAKPKTVQLDWTQNSIYGTNLNWGDGTGVEMNRAYGLIRSTHVYSNYGDYTITLENVVPGSVSEFPRLIGISDMIDRVSMNEEVNSIKDFAFQDYERLESIEFTDNTSKIGDGAFSGCRIGYATIPEHVTEMGRGVFADCDLLTTVGPVGTDAALKYSWHDTIIDNAFANDNMIHGVEIEDGITSIGQNSFDGCTNLSSVAIPDSVEHFGNYAFANCPKLMNITIPANCKSIGDAWMGGSVFAGGPVDPSYEIPVMAVCPNGYEFSSEVEPKVAEALNVARNVYYKWTDEIPPYAFYEAEGEIFAVIEDRITVIRNNAFMNTKTMILRMSPNLKRIETGAFRNTIVKNALLPNGLEYIGESAYNLCASLETLGDYGIPSTVTYIGPRAFANTTSLHQDVIIPSGVTKIENKTFFNSVITKVVIPEGCVEIGDQAFDECYELKKVVLKMETPPTIGSNSFPDDCVYAVPENSVELYKKAWPEKSDYIYADKPQVFFGDLDYGDMIAIPSTIMLEKGQKYNTFALVDVFFENGPVSYSIATAGDNVTECSIISDEPYNYFDLTAGQIVGSETITLVAQDSVDSASIDIIVNVVESIPEPVAVIEADPTAEYGFVLGEDGYYENQNKGKNSTVASCIVRFNGCGVYIPVFDCISDSESGYDYGILSGINNPNYEEFNFIRKPGQNTATYGVAPNRESYIVVSYIKDSSGSEGADSFKFKVRFEKFIPEI